MLPRMLAVRFVAVFSLLSLSPAASAQTCAKTFGPMGPEIRPAETLLGDQVSSRVARGPNGWVVAWSDTQDVYARRFDLDLRPTSPEFVVDTFFNQDAQDEPAIAFGSTGNFLVAWTDHHGYDGSGLGIMARIYDSNGTSVTSEFVVNSTTASSQFHPSVAPTPSGGWVIGWTGDSDGNAYIRILSTNGVFLSGDVAVNTYRPGSQRDVSVAVNPSSVIFATFVDFSSHGGVGTGSNLYARMFSSTGTPLQTQEFLVPTAPSNGDQLNPFVAADGLGRFLVVWEDQLADGSGSGIVERVFDHNGVPFLPETLVNTTLGGDQTTPAIAVDQIGRAIVTWTDFSAGAASPAIRARRYNGQANPFGPDFVANEFPPIGTISAVPVMDFSGTDIVLGYQGPGAQGNGVDVYVRQYKSTSGPHVYCTAKVNSQGCTPTIGFAGDPSATSGAPFLITGTNIINQKLGLMFYGYDSSFTPFQGSTICVKPPLRRMPGQNSGGSVSGNDCSGTLSTDFNVRIRSGSDSLLVPGATISTRWYYRDPHDAAGYGTGLTDALRFAICP